MTVVSRGRGGWPRALALAVVAWFCGCTESAGEGAQEVAAELRALRTTLQAQATRSGPAGGVAPAQEQVRAALQPLREVLTALGQEQKDLQARQLTLTQELQRWSQLLAQTVTATGRSETESLVARLQALEAQLKAQDVRHREVEDLLGKALDRTADRLDEFLQQLSGKGAPAPAPANLPGNASTEPAPGATPPVERSAPTPKVGGVAPAAPPGAAPRHARQAATLWWWLLGAAALTGAGFAWRWRRGDASQRSEHAAATAAVPAFDPGAEEIWAAAALLGEAVGRLRQAGDQAEDVAPLAMASEPAGSAVPAAEPEPAAQEFASDDVFVIEEDAEPPRPPAPRAVVTGRPQILPRMLPPHELDCHLRVGDPARAMASVLLLLAGDPRVLRRPQPTVAMRGDGIDVHFAVLPALPMGERTALEQRLRDAVA